MHAIEFKNVSFRYEEEQPYVLRNVSFQVEAGEWLAIIGHNGSGKSTIAKLMNGLLFPTEGEIIINGIPLNEENIWEIRRQVGMVFQNPDNQFVGTTVRDDVAFGLENRGVPRAEMMDRITSSLEQVRMQDYLLHEPYRLSGGQKQRVAIAGVLAISPSVIILDEATAMLDPLGRKEILDTVHRVQAAQQLGLITITHDLNEVMQAHRVLVMNDGEIWTTTVPRELVKRQTELQQIGLDVPFVTQLAHALERQGINLAEQPIDHEELLDALWTLHSNK
ncbi:energy-coupling factor transporter ATPase [Terribacillus saccharophilus]|jgi:energy-coupling factor transport system ATP-binding protein|uniref:Energy-coupling factor transporter ATPase n=1 Tax=Terribacillus saccharophilus TaxID=361277 RepID=A0A268H901_9BACI|nr:energy-coupling factor ABC transporter ATP-binding protein [Terribacillus saccharophilus]PAE06341.1 energy-coupling factor transporter ATPase [Terribacillus saccharophilus]